MGGPSYADMARATVAESFEFLAGCGIYIAGAQMTASAAELNYLDITAAGTAEANKAVVLGSSKEIDTMTVTALKLAVASNVVSAGSAIGEGGSLAAGINVVTGADNTKVVDLPTAVAGTVLTVISATVAKSLPVYPAAGAQIDNAAANAAVTLGAATAYTSGMFLAVSSTAWVTILGDTA